MKISVRGLVNGEQAEATLEDGQLQGDPWLRAMVGLFVGHEFFVRLPGVIEGPATLNDEQLAAATLYSVCDEGTAELTIEPRRWWLMSGRVVAGRRTPAA